MVMIGLLPAVLALPLCRSILLLLAMNDISSGQLISLFRTGRKEIIFLLTVNFLSVPPYTKKDHSFLF